MQIGCFYLRLNLSFLKIVSNDFPRSKIEDKVLGSNYGTCQIMTLSLMLLNYSDMLLNFVVS